MGREWLWARCLRETEGLSDRVERAKIYFSLAMTESGGEAAKVAGNYSDTSYAAMVARGSEPSRGLFQMHLRGAASGLVRKFGEEKTWALLADPDIQFAHFVHPAVDPAFDAAYFAGFRGADLATEVGRRAERPAEGLEVAYGRTYARLFGYAGY